MLSCSRREICHGAQNGRCKRMCQRKWHKLSRPGKGSRHPPVHGKRETTRGYRYQRTNRRWTPVLITLKSFEDQILLMDPISSFKLGDWPPSYPSCLAWRFTEALHALAILVVYIHMYHFFATQSNVLRWWSLRHYQMYQY